MSTQIVIEKSIPIPPRKSVFPFSKLEVGDSFEVSLTSTTANSVRACASAYAKRHGVSFSCRINEGKIRVWRTA